MTLEMSLNGIVEFIYQEKKGFIVAEKYKDRKVVERKCYQEISIQNKAVIYRSATASLTPGCNPLLHIIPQSLLCTFDLFL